MEHTQENAAQNTRWYALRVVSGKEKKIKEAIENNIRSEWSDFEWAAHIRDILLPMEKVYKMQKGKRIQKERNRFPGYLIVEVMQPVTSGESKGMNEDLRDAINNMDNVIHFLGKGTPTPLREDEVAKMLGKIDEMAESATILEEVPEKGDAIKITDGPFNGFNGIIEEVNREKKKAKVIIRIFGKETIAEINLLEIERL